MLFVRRLLSASAAAPALPAPSARTAAATSGRWGKANSLRKPARRSRPSMTELSAGSSKPPKSAIEMRLRRRRPPPARGNPRSLPYFFVRRGAVYRRSEDARLRSGEQVFVKEPSGDWALAGTINSTGGLPPPPEVTQNDVQTNGKSPHAAQYNLSYHGLCRRPRRVETGLCGCG